MIRNTIASMGFILATIFFSLATPLVSLGYKFERASLRLMKVR